MEIYHRIEAKLRALEKLTDELNYKLKSFEELTRHIDELDRKLKELAAYSAGRRHV